MNKKNDRWKNVSIAFKNYIYVVKLRKHFDVEYDNT